MYHWKQLGAFGASNAGQRIDLGVLLGSWRDLRNQNRLRRTEFGH